MYGPITVPIGFACECSWTRNIFISTDGFVVMGDLWESAPPRPLEVPFQRSDQDTRQPKVVAPLWTDLKYKPGVSNIWFHTYYKYAPDASDWDRNISAVKTFVGQNSQLAEVDAVQATVITWENMIPFDVEAATTEEFVTFQLVLVTDAIHTYSIVNYEHLSWTPSKHSSRPAAILQQCNVLYNSHPASGTTDIYKKAFEHSNSADGTIGRYIYTLDFCPSTYENSRHKCYEWRHNELQNTTISDVLNTVQTTTTRCPCDANSAKQNKNFQNSTEDGICFSSVFPTIDDFGSRLCCYKESPPHTLLTTLQSGSGYLSLHHPTRAAHLHQIEDVDPYTWCCKESDASLCELFEELRPVDDCKKYKPDTPCFMFGDPHIRTLDGSQFTFNGHGEYQLLEVIDDTTGEMIFTFQGRTEPAISSMNNEPVNATLFSSFAAEDKIHGGFVDVEINLGRDGFIVFSNTYDEAIDDTLDLHTGKVIMHRNVRVELERSTLIISFTNGISLSVLLSSGLLDSSLTIPKVYKDGYTFRGLMGNYDDDTENDLMYLNRTVIPSNSTDREIFNYGETWRINASSSRFHYRAGQSHADYQFPDFVPLFLDDYNETQLAEARAICGTNNLCVYDYLATLNMELAMDTTVLMKNADEITTESRNTAPTVEFTRSRIEANLGDTVTIEIKVVDIDPAQNVTLFFIGPVTMTKEFAQNTTFAYNWTIDSLQPMNISAYANDSVVTSSLASLDVSLCTGCSGNGVCLYDEPEATCQCEPGWEGTDCSDDVDGCSGNPCAGNSICSDLTPLQEQILEVKYDCQCTMGYRKVDQKCIDIDECDNATTCDQICKNTEGGYTCSCRQGYTRTQNRCEDTNECTMGLHDCEHTCINLIGTYSCSCQANYTLGDDGRSCTPTVTVKMLCDARGCEQGCMSNPGGGVSCFCNHGYTLNDDGISCDDLDECTLPLCSQECSNTIGSFRCSCYDGYTLSSDQLQCEECSTGFWGPSCSETCDCVHAVSCNKVLGCVCQAGWMGVKCDVNINECRDTVNLCTEKHDCVDTLGSYSCVCKTGYRETADNSCENINECDGGDNDCDPDNAICIDTIGSYRCQCAQGYIGDGYNCNDVNECDLTNQCEHNCVNVHGTYNCECYIGHLLLDDRRTCEKSSDPCVGSLNNVTDPTCTQQGAHGCRVEELNGVCYCRNGYELTASGACQAINECEPNQGLGPCSDRCVDPGPGFLCECNNGRRLLNDDLNCEACNKTFSWGVDCENTCNCGTGSDYCDSLTGCICKSGWRGVLCDIDINECDTSPCSANQICTDTPGSYKCTCNTGYQFSDDGKSCEDIDECTSVTNPCSQRCDNNDGSFECRCRHGFTFATGSTTECINIDECATNIHDCEQVCVDNAGSFICQCQDGFLLKSDRKSCEKDITTDPCDTYNITCSYGCQVVNNQPQCYCAAEHILNPIDNSTCKALNNKIWALLTVDIDFIEAYRDPGSQEYKDLIGDLRATLIEVYQSNNLSKFLDIRIETLSPVASIEITHAVIFDTNNVTETEYLNLASVLKDLHYDVRYIGINQKQAAIIREPLVSYTIDGNRTLVTCLLCQTGDQCALLNSLNDTYTCHIQPELTQSVPIEIEILQKFDTSISNKLSPLYATMSNGVQTTLKALFGQSVTGFAGLGPVTFTEGSILNGGSTVLRTSVLFNTTIGISQTSSVAGRLVDLDNNNCIDISGSCIEIVGQTKLGKQGIKAICETCTDKEECTIDKLTNEYKCTPIIVTDITVTEPDDSDLILGLGIGIPMFVIFIAILVIIIILCVRRRRYRDDRSYSSGDSDPYLIRQAFGSLSSAFSRGGKTQYGTDGFFNRQYARRWDQTQDIDEPGTVINYYRDPDTTRDPYRQVYEPSTSRQYIAPSAPPEEPQVVSDFSWDFLYNALQPNNQFRIQRPLVEGRPAEVFRTDRRDSHA